MIVEICQNLCQTFSVVLDFSASFTKMCEGTRHTLRRKTLPESYPLNKRLVSRSISLTFMVLFIEILYSSSSPSSASLEAFLA